MNFLKKVFILILAIQFLNVQVQSSFAADSIISLHPEVLEITQRATVRLANALKGKRDSFIESFAYRIYKKSIRGRNHLFDDSEHDANPIQGSGLSRDLAIDPEIMEDAEFLTSLKSEGLDQSDSTAYSGVMSRKQKLESADRVLFTIGSSVDGNGRMSPLDFESFKVNLHELKSLDQAKKLSHSVTVVKILLALLAVFSGIFCLGASIMILILGGTSVLMLILIAGLIVAEIYAMKGIFSFQAPNRGFRVLHV